MSASLRETGSRADASSPSVSTKGFDPARIAEAVSAIEPSVLQPLIKKAADDFYERLLGTTEDYLRENLAWNISSHISMLERENQRMRTELYEVDRKLGGSPLDHENRLKSIGSLETASHRYHEMLWAVSQKHEGEERHETALRYIRERETGASTAIEARGEQP